MTVFTTRPDTLYGATYMVIAPEHPYVDLITSDEQREAVAAYVNAAKSKSDLERAELAKEKTGVATGAYAVNPVNGKKIPVWVADYVLMTYGTGAIMAVPAHDERDFEFALEFGLSIRPVIDPPETWIMEQEPVRNLREVDWGPHVEERIPRYDLTPGDFPEAYTGDGPLINSGDLNGLRVAEAKEKIIARLEAEGRGKATVNYRLRDWLFSRQRYWGEPFPIVWVKRADFDALPAYQREFLLGAEAQTVTCNMEGESWVAVPLREDALPLTLPEVNDYQPSPDGQSPLAKAGDWLHVYLNPETGEIRGHGERMTEPTELVEDHMARPASGPPSWIEARRETNTMPQWAGSCWYYLRYMDPTCDTAPVGPEAEKYWQCPDLYVGGAEHAVLHLLYARFWHQVLFDCGAVTTKEPFPKLFHQGLILGEDGEKMSKSRGNVINPDDVIKEHGADALRVYLMFLGPLEQGKPWNTENIKGVTRFLRDMWRLCVGEDGGAHPKVHAGEETAETLKALHTAIKKVTGDYETLSFNTAVSAMMVLKNHLAKQEAYARSTLKTLLQLLAPLAPHVCEELWERLGEAPSIANAPWPRHDESLLVEDSVTLPVQIMGKVKGEVTVAKGAPKEDILAAAKAVDKVAVALAGKTITKEIYVPGRIVNFVAK
ncbi:MAG: class I tRNA ligase family protein [Opitutales bacterium]